MKAMPQNASVSFSYSLQIQRDKVIQKWEAFFHRP